MTATNGQIEVRDNNGKFLSGNKLGGNPMAGAVNRYRNMLNKAAEAADKDESRSRFEKVADKLLTLAEQGEEWAVKELFNRLMGRVKEESDGEGPKGTMPTIVVISGPDAETKLAGFGARMAQITQEGKDAQSPPL